MTSSQLEASAQAPCSSTITGLSADPPAAVAVTAEAAWPGTNASRTAARAAAKSAGRPISHVMRLTDMSAPSRAARRRAAPIDLPVEVGYARYPAVVRL